MECAPHGVRKPRLRLSSRKLCFPAAKLQPPRTWKRPVPGVNREVVVAPCRVFYKVEKNDVYILYVMRSEGLLRTFLLQRRDDHKQGFTD
jgi:hypothetical protein